MAAAYDATRAHDLAIVVGGVVPILLVAAFAVPVPRVRNADEASAALGELIAAAVLLTLALLTEMLALFGVAYGLGRKDEQFLFSLLFFTAIAALRRMIAPLVLTYANGRRIPSGRLWAILVVLTLVLSFGMVFLLAFAERH